MFNEPHVMEIEQGITDIHLHAKNVTTFSLFP